MAEKMYFTGLDPGQVNDPTALAVVQRAELQGEWDPAAFAWRKETVLRLRHLERVPLGTPYPEMVRRVAQVTRSGEMAGKCELFVDATGVGRPVVDLLRTAGLQCPINPVIITGGHAESYVNGFLHIPKKDLITGLQLALQRGALQIAAGLGEGAAFLKEMTDMRVRVTGPGHEQFGAWREGTHDDLVFAVALACLGAKRRYPKDLSHQTQYWTGGSRGAGNSTGGY